MNDDGYREELASSQHVFAHTQPYGFDHLMQGTKPMKRRLRGQADTVSNDPADILLISAQHNNSRYTSQSERRSELQKQRSS
jgi:hypothetical protein